MGSGCGWQQLHHVGKVHGDPGILPGPSEVREAVGEWGRRDRGSTEPPLRGLPRSQGLLLTSSSTLHEHFARFCWENCPDLDLQEWLCRGCIPEPLLTPDTSLGWQQLQGCSTSSSTSRALSQLGSMAGYSAALWRRGSCNSQV